MNNIFSKLRDFVGLNEPVEYEYYEEEQDNDNYQTSYQPENPHPAAQETTVNNRRWRETPPTVTQEEVAGSKNMTNVIGMPGAINGISEVLVLEPRTFEEMPQAIQALRERKSLVLNLTIMDPDQAQRAVDFIAGGTYALDGHQERIGESIFLFTPSCVQVSTQGGFLHEVPQPPVRPVRNTGNWGSEPNRMAQ
ncbi:cell division protein SepF [Cylindrospermopsis raciborskii]|uniref:Cell division protein SepF n=1 Tax=Cylindrospermopsis raciborskii CENA302 TaxID=1170768 RepID=A0A9Q5W7R0_9CYAN|nr:cell division protein SepF [Cylindrospermopsis raciborskii]MCZ2202386.1 cell division protein SepF [Cylindrospermopsis raciborskii PAMP2012]MCZ2206041.1 cell division protein SepF [Cylindrospermopsis raciborskii PAMP2011]NLQ05969.1 cell division protein SepF [Cylindrospermopsis raciborskii MVCC19]OHY32284.1 cell division protein SepF [Cylindrospermopsis raciborskii MVCC14]OPH08800.1 cell division protein SepF [Cylindrospermopsis raciborskii CENA302]